MAQAIRSNLNSGGTFWDVGANIGLFSLLAARIVGQNGKVVSFEPAPDVFKLLHQNVQNSSGIIQAIQCGIGNVDGSCLMSVQGTTSAGSFIEEVVELTRHYHPDIAVRRETVAIRKLDTLLNDLQVSPTLIKIDIEGYEVEALRGATFVLQTAQPILIIEIHPLQLKLSGSSEDELFRLLREHSYSFEVINRNPNTVYSIVAKPRPL